MAREEARQRGRREGHSVSRRGSWAGLGSREANTVLRSQVAGEREAGEREIREKKQEREKSERPRGERGLREDGKNCALRRELSQEQSTDSSFQKPAGAQRNQRPMNAHVCEACAACAESAVLPESLKLRPPSCPSLLAVVAVKGQPPLDQRLSRIRHAGERWTSCGVHTRCPSPPTPAVCPCLSAPHICAHMSTPTFLSPR